MAFTSIAALVAGEAVTSALVLSAVTEIGLAMTVVGAVTGSKSLMKIGAVMGTVGGVGGMINGMANAAGSAAMNTASTEATASALPESVYGSAAQEAGDQAAIAGMQGGAVPSAVEGASSASEFGKVLEDATSSLETGSAATDVAQTAAETAPKAPEALQPTTQNVTQPAPEPTTGNNPSAYSADGSKIPFQPDTSQLTGMQTTDYFKSFLGWVKQNKEVANGVLKIGGEALKGMSERDMFDQKMELENKKYGYGNQVANFNPRPLIGAR